MYSTKFMFFGPIGKTRWLPWPLIGLDILDFLSETTERNSTKLDKKQDLNVLNQVFVFRDDRNIKTSLNPLQGIQPNLTGIKISMSPTKFVFFGPIRKKRWPPWLQHFYFFSETAERNSPKLDRKQDLNVFYQVCVFQANK